MVDPASAAGAVSGTLDILGKLEERVSGPDTKIENQEIVFRCPEDRGEYSVVLRVPGGPSGFFSRTVDFPLPELTRMSVKSLPMCADQGKAVQRTEQGYRLHTNYLDDRELFLIDFEFETGDRNSFDSLVRRDTERDNPGTSGEEAYWMSAQLRHLETLDSEYGTIELQDYNFSVDVAIHQDIKNVVPKPFERRVKIISEWIQEEHRERKQQLDFEHIREMKGRDTGNEAEILSSIQDLFVPSKFADFVDISDPYRYDGAKQGTDFYDDVPFPTFPKHMDVVARTDLSLEEPAADGELRYHRRDFREALNDLFPETADELDNAGGD